MNQLMPSWVRFNCSLLKIFSSKLNTWIPEHDFNQHAEIQYFNFFVLEGRPMVKPVVISARQGIVQKKLPKRDDDLNSSTFSLEKSIMEDKRTTCRKLKKEELTDVY